MKTTALTIASWGNSHGIRLSRELMQSLGITPGTPLQATVVAKGCLELRAVPQRPSLQWLLTRYMKKADATASRLMMTMTSPAKKAKKYSTRAAKRRPVLSLKKMKPRARFHACDQAYLRH